MPLASSFRSSRTSSWPFSLAEPSRRDFLAAVNGVLLAFLGARVVQERAAPDRDAEVRLLDVAEHFLVERVGEGLDVSWSWPRCRRFPLRGT